MTTNAVLCYIRDGGRVLLQLKADGRFGGGFWNGPGGKIAEGESPEEAAVREVREETGLIVRDLRDCGALTFYVEGIEGPDINVRVYMTERFAGELQASEEGALSWFPEDALPYDQMWEDDRVWVPHVLAGRRVRASFRFSANYGKLLRHQIRVLK
jgi:8-oxo-dGTP diphosphatase